MDFVCLGNVLGHQAESLAYENTHCPGCGELLIRRWGLGVTRYRLKDKKCPQCGRTTSVVASAGGTCYEPGIDLPAALC
jgi:pyruvate formate lyase activating enzyme